MTNHEKLILPVRSKYQEFTYQQVKDIADETLTCTDSGKNYATLKFLQKNCYPIGLSDEIASNFINQGGDPRGFNMLNNVKNDWEFKMKLNVPPIEITTKFGSSGKNSILKNNSAKMLDALVLTNSKIALNKYKHAEITTITLTKQQIHDALTKVEKGLDQYLDLQKMVNDQNDFYQKDEFRKKYNHFYRVRRKLNWRNDFYELMSKAKREQLEFPKVLKLLYKATTRYEASFSSKLVATVNPSMPIIDSIVLKNLGLRLPYSSNPNRVEEICEIHKKIIFMYNAYLSTSDGQYLVDEFKCKYPDANITKVKMLDLVLWQTRT